MARASTKAGAKSGAKSKGEGLSASTRMVLLFGEDRFRQETALDELRAALAEVHGEEGFDAVRYDAAAPGGSGGGSGGGLSAEILDECRTMGLMTRYKLIVVENADALLKGDGDDEEGESAPAKPASGRARGGPRTKSNRELFEAYAADPSETATLVLRASRWRPGKLDKAVEALGPRGAVLKCEAMNPAEAMKWVRDRSQSEHGVSISPEAAQLLVSNVGTELGRLDTELAKLAMVKPGKPIDAEAVEQFVGFSREEDFWRIQESLLAGDPGAALRRLKDMIEISRHQPVPLAWAYTDLARKVYSASVGLAAGENPGSISKRLRLWGASQDFILKAARKLPPPRAAQLLAAAVENDVRLKSSHGDPVTNLEALTVRFTSVLA